MNETIQQIMAVLYRNIIWSYRSPFRLADVFIWPLLLLFTFTFFLLLVGYDVQYIGIIVLAVIAWKGMFFVTFEISTIFVEEHWDDSLPNLLVSPITAFTLAMGGAITGLLKSLLVLIICLAVSFLAYGFVLTDLLTFAIGIFFIFLSSFSIGFALFGLACCYDKRNIFTLGFVLPEVLGLLCGPYFNVEQVFPQWFVSIVNLFPMTHAFNVIKSVFGLAQPDYFMLIITTVIWLGLSIVIHHTFYDMGRRKGTLVKVG
ncbi:ABC transporter permease [Candidatus Micrarchaeota archaeon]|nr:ABC transporter permease [Candidatus Micrarchaeota archaeon]MBU1165527.1 ABC transporter permease [Candidatus Micrarchaeota archaeon]MBU1886530.1 ABC transporter permease [Candidatus Micrarchaeota archaeon]